MRPLIVRLTDNQHEYLRQEAFKKNIRISQLIRERLSIDPDTESLREYDKEIWRREVKLRDNFKCFSCGIQGTSRTTEAHHVKPKEQGGKNILTNGITLCRSCHRAVHIDMEKTGKNLGEF